MSYIDKDHSSSRRNIIALLMLSIEGNCLKKYIWENNQINFE